MPVGSDVCWNSLWLALTVGPENRAVGGPLWLAALYGGASTVGMGSGLNGIEQIWI
jgi:hypothetical protein